MSIDKVEAIRLVEIALNKERDWVDVAETGPIVVVDSSTFETGYGWVFFVNTAKYLKTRERRYCVIGGVWMFDARNSLLTALPSGMSVEEAIEWYEKRQFF